MCADEALSEILQDRWSCYRSNRGDTDAGYTIPYKKRCTCGYQHIYTIYSEPVSNGSVLLAVCIQEFYLTGASAD